MGRRLTGKFELRTLQLAFKTTTPVLCGYLAIGVAFGLLLQNAGYHWLLALVMSVFIYAGAGQYIAVGLFANNAGFLEVATITFLVNFRHMVYGLSLFEKFSLSKLLKPYMIFSLTDETYALLTSVKDPAGVNRAHYYFFIAALNQSYWVLGSVVGAVAGNFIAIDTTGLDFALTALFIVIVLEQIKSFKSPLPFIIGGGCALCSLLVAGKGNMLLLAVVSAILALLIMKKRIAANESD